MIRNLRDIICLVAAVLLTGLAACHANDTASCSSDFRLASILENFQQDSFNPGKSSPENFMEQNIAGAAGISANGCVSPRCQSSIKASVLQNSISAIAQTVSSCAEERHFSISRLNDYYVFGLGHIII